MFEKQGSYASGVDSLMTRDENHPLHKPMVDHDHVRVVQLLMTTPELWSYVR